MKIKYFDVNIMRYDFDYNEMYIDSLLYVTTKNKQEIVKSLNKDVYVDNSCVKEFEGKLSLYAEIYCPETNGVYKTIDDAKRDLLTVKIAGLK